MNKIEWHDWGEVAFEKARTLDRPVLLALSATWCHWCHVMDSTSYSSIEVIELINSQLVPIRVDIDKRPDISDRYNFGGFPTTAFLTPSGNVITGGTYIPPEMLKALIAEVIVTYRRDKQKLMEKERPAEIKTKLKAEAQDLGFQLSECETIIFEFFDSENGGFGVEPKFPQPKIIELALFYYHLKPEKSVLAVINRTLSRMRASKLYDVEERGFFRYSVTRNWGTPHYEKMLETNSLLLKNYVEAYHAFENPGFEETAKGIIRYLDKNLRNEKGGFFGSQDADEQYYKSGLEERQKKQAPSIDRTIYVNWNALAISAYLQAHTVLGISSCKEFAFKTIEFLLRNCRSKKGMYHYYDGAPKIEGLLRDQVCFAKALLDAYQASGEIKFLDSAMELVDLMYSDYYDNEAGGFFDLSEGREESGALIERHKSPSENFAAAELLAKLHHLTGHEEHKKKATSALLFFSDLYPDLGMQAADFALASLAVQQSPVQITIVGSRSDERAQMLLKEALKIYEPRKIVQLFDPDADANKLTNIKFPVQAEPVAYLCLKGVCLPPIIEISEIRKKIEDFKEKAR